MSRSFAETLLRLTAPQVNVRHCPESCAPGATALSRATQFIPNHSAQRCLQRFLLVAYETTQSPVDQRLVVSAARVVDLLAKPLQNIFVEADGNPRLFRRHSEDRTAPSLAEIIFLLHSSPAIGGSPAALPAGLRSIECCCPATWKRSRERALTDPIRPPFRCTSVH